MRHVPGNNSHDIQIKLKSVRQSLWKRTVIIEQNDRNVRF